MTLDVGHGGPTLLLRGTAKGVALDVGRPALRGPMPCRGFEGPSRLQRIQAALEALEARTQVADSLLQMLANLLPAAAETISTAELL